MSRVDSSINTFNTTLSSTFSILKNLSNTIGVNYIFNKGEKKYGAFYDLSLLFAKRFTLRVRVGTNVYDSEYLDGENNYTQLMGRTILSAKF
jgi:hypothetical protein